MGASDKVLTLERIVEFSMSMDIADLRRKAEAGSCASQSVLGLCYLYGAGVEIDYGEALRFLSAAADQGASRAVLNLGIMYAEGLGVAQDVAEAIRLLEAVARPDDSSDAFLARIELGRTYAQRASPAKPAAALKWYSAAVALAAPGADSAELREARNYIAVHGRQK